MASLWLQLVAVANLVLEKESGALRKSAWLSNDYFFTFFIILKNIIFKIENTEINFI